MGISDILLIAFLILVGLLLYLLRPTKDKLPEMEVPFEEIAKIWLPYNEKVSPVPVEESDVVENLFEENTSKTDETNETTDVEVVAQETADVSETNAKTDTKKEKDITKDISAPTMDNEFWKDCVVPYMDTIKGQDAMDVIKELIELLEKHGHNPSVVLDNNDSEALELVTVRDNLAKVTLKEHSYQVTRLLIDIIKNNYKEYQQLVPKAIITGLGHDIGKIPEFRLTGVYNTYEHPLVSANKLSEIFTGHDIFWAKSVIQAVRDHHQKTVDQWTSFLKQADTQARQMELIRFTKDFKIKKFEEWFDVNTFLKKLDPYINVTQTNKWQAFSCKGVIYCKTELLLDIAKEMVKEAKALDLSLIYESERDTVYRKIVSALRKENLIPDIIAENQWSRRFEIKTSQPSLKKHKAILTPIKMDDRFNIAEIESRKQGFTEIITDVVVC